jgi:hypothetical protein
MAKNLIQEMEQEVVDHIGEVGDDALSSLGKKCTELVEVRNELVELEEKKKELSKREFNLENEEIPAVMEENNLTSLRLKDGQKIDVTESYHATITAANKDFCFNWLKENGLDDIIKNEVSVAFGRGENDDALDLKGQLEGQGLPVEHSQKIHSQTLKAFVGERVRSGDGVPDEFGVFIRKKVKIRQ